MRWLTVGPPNQAEVNIVLHPPAADPGITEDERRVIAEMTAEGTYGSIKAGLLTGRAAGVTLIRPRAALPEE
jgi:hypothetical protein